MSHELFAGRRVAHNVGWNLAGQILPIVVAIASTPFLVSHLGTSRFGILVLSWALVGYFGTLDFGMGRALTQAVAARTGFGEEADIEPLIWTSLALMLALGLLGSILLEVLVPYVVGTLLRVPDGLRLEAIRASYLLAAAIPVVLTTAGLRGVLEGRQHFKQINVVRIGMGLLTYLGPLVVAIFTPDLGLIVAVLVAGRIVAWIVHFVLVFRLVPLPLISFSIRPQVLPPLLTIGAWMTFGNLMSPILGYLDRFWIAAIVSVAAAAYYGAPYEMLTRLWLVPVALSGVLFPAFAATFRRNPERTATLFNSGVKVTFVVLFPLLLLAAVFSPEFMTIWLGGAFAQNSVPVVRFLAAGVLMNSMAQVAFALIQGIGRPAYPAILLALEVPVYVTLLSVLVPRAGLVGAAAAWALRAGLDAFGLFVVAHRLLGGGGHLPLRPALTLVVALALIMVAGAPGLFVMRAAITFPILIGFVASTWLGWLTPAERRFAIDGFQRMSQRGRSYAART